MPQIQRKYPRVAFDQPADIAVRIRGERIRIPVTIRSISCEGVGLSLAPEHRQHIPRGATVILSFDADGGDFEIPGRVVWSVSPTSVPGEVDVGVRLQLELAPYVMRQAYASWIVSVLQEAVATNRAF